MDACTTSDGALTYAYAAILYVEVTVIIRAVGIAMAAALVLASASCGVDTKASCQSLGSDIALPFVAAQASADPLAIAPLQRTPAQAQAFHNAAAKLRQDAKRAGGAIETAADRVANVYDKTADAITTGASTTELSPEFDSADNALYTACGGPQNMTSQ